MNEKSKIYIRLSEFLFKCQKTDVNYYICKTLLSLIDEFPNITIEQIAYLSHTTAPTVTKFCKRLGYQSFKEMREDIEEYSPIGFFDEGENQSISDLLESQRAIEKEIYKHLDYEQIKRIATIIAEEKKIVALGNSYSFNSVNFLRELLSQLGIVVYEINRGVKKELLEDIILESKNLLIISLTNRWLVKEKQLLETIDATNFLLTVQADEEMKHCFEEIVEFSQFEFFFRSNHYSQKVIQIWIMALGVEIKNLLK
ncbi:MAG: MurR/RpiR family transcriptional regulator [Streptococcaceae bacterium]|nr:MurR/RpiR family transcriptional regulator [Streptococcaceae bacterium]